MDRFISTIVRTAGPTTDLAGSTLASVLPGGLTRSQVADLTRVLGWYGQGTIIQQGRCITVTDTTF